MSVPASPSLGRKKFWSPHFTSFIALMLVTVMFFALYSHVAAVWLSDGNGPVEERYRALFGKETFSGLSALFAGLAFAGVISTLVLQERQLRKAIDDFEDSNRDLHYGELDRLYYDLLKIALDKPYLRSDPRTLDDARKQEYAIYAHMVWNFIETIHDRISSAPENDRRQLLETWEKVESSEMKLHEAWWRTAAIDNLFKASFVTYATQRLALVAAGEQRSGHGGD